MDDKLPKIGESVRITKIVEGIYVVWEGCGSPGGGLYWTEFSAT
ncbi:MAG TPA: hypothetical protein VNE82_06500 [Candidatus Binataceae bacterium]|nr:hypothetical protein [Candidatus Binataceae bacterium]